MKSCKLQTTIWSHDIVLHAFAVLDISKKKRLCNAPLPIAFSEQEVLFQRDKKKKVQNFKKRKMQKLLKIIYCNNLSYCIGDNTNVSFILGLQIKYCLNMGTQRGLSKLYENARRSPATTMHVSLSFPYSVLVRQRHAPI